MGVGGVGGGTGSKKKEKTIERQQNDKRGKVRAGGPRSDQFVMSENMTSAATGEFITRLLRVPQLICRNNTAAL